MTPIALQWPLVGRDPELIELRAHLARAAGGDGGLVLLGGEAGGGKTALLGALVELSDGIACATGRCSGPGETPTFGPLVQMVEHLQIHCGADGSDLPSPFGRAPEPESGMGARAGALLRWFGKLGRPLLLILEDLHWADSATLELLRTAAGQVTEWPILLVATYRTDDVHRAHPLWSLLPALDRLGATRILLERLSLPAVEQLVRAALPAAPEIPEVARRLHARSGGHVLFVRDLLLAALRSGGLSDSDDLPETVQQAIDARLAGLPTGAQSLLQTAAIIGERFDYDLLTRVAEMGEDEVVEALEQATAHRVIRPFGQDGEEFTFDHALVREALVNRMIGPRRRKWHKRIADALIERGHVDPERVALHLHRAGDPRALEYLIEAGRRAHSIDAHLQATAHFEHALEIISDHDPRRAELLLRLGASLAHVDQARATACFEDTMRLASETGDRVVEVLALHIVRAPIMSQLPSEAEMLEVEARQRELLNDPRYQQLCIDLYGSFERFPRMAFLRVRQLIVAGRMAEAGQLFDELMALAGDVRLPDNLYGTNLFMLRLRGRVRDLIDQMQEFVTRPGLIPSDQHGMQVRLALLLLVYAGDQPERFAAAWKQALELERAVRERTPEHSPFLLADLKTRVHYLQGNWEAAFSDGIASWQQARLPRMTEIGARTYGALLLLARGKDGEAAALMQRFHPLHPDDEPDSVGNPWMQRWVHAEIALARGEFDLAERWLQAALRWLETVPLNIDGQEVFLAMAEARRRQGDLTGARRWAEKALAESERVHHCPMLVRSYRMLGELAAAPDGAGTAEAERCFAASADLAQRCQYPYELALTRLARARTLPGAAGVQADLQSALELFGRLGAAPARAEAEALLARSGTSLLPDGLTAREVEVIHLVAQGLSDKEVAARLFISPRTVDGHLRNIFGKLDIQGRAALAAYAARHGWTS